MRAVELHWDILDLPPVRQKNSTALATGLTLPLGNGYGTNERCRPNMRFRSKQRERK